MFDIVVSTLHTKIDKNMMTKNKKIVCLIEGGQSFQHHTQKACVIHNYSTIFIGIKQIHNNEVDRITNSSTSRISTIKNIDEKLWT